jgi:penicillin-binding protein 1A
MNTEDRTKQIIKLLYIGSAVLVSLVVIHVVAVIYDLGGLYGGMPSLEKLANPRSEVASEVYSADNQLLGKYFKENRSPVTYEQISPNVIKTLYATEDVRFDEHSGIDLKGLSSIAY